jgi:hypothetical protein
MTSFRVFMAKRMKAQTDNPVTVLNWNRANGLFACGYQSGSLNLCAATQSRNQPGSTIVETVQPIDFHRKPITCIAWREDGEILSIGDTAGKVSWWQKRGSRP